MCVSYESVNRAFGKAIDTVRLPGGAVDDDDLANAIVETSRILAKEYYKIVVKLISFQ